MSLEVEKGTGSFQGKKVNLEDGQESEIEEGLFFPEEILLLIFQKVFEKETGQAIQNRLSLLLTCRSWNRLTQDSRIPAFSMICLEVLDIVRKEEKEARTFLKNSVFLGKNIEGPWNSESLLEYTNPYQPTNYGRGLELSSCGQFFVAGWTDSQLILMDIQNKKVTHSFQGHSDFVSCVAFSPCKDLVASGSGVDDRSVKLWDTKTGRCLDSFHWNKGKVADLKFSPCGHFLAASSSDYTIRILEIKQKGEKTFLEERTVTAPEADGYVTSLAFSPCGQFVWGGTSSGRLLRWNCQSGERKLEFLTGDKWIDCIEISPCGRYLLHSSNKLYYWRVLCLKTGLCIQHSALEREKGISDQWRTAAMTFSPCGQWILTGYQNGCCVLWSRKTGKAMWKALDHYHRVGALAFSPDGDCFFTHDSTQIKKWSIASITEKKNGKCSRGRENK